MPVITLPDGSSKTFNKNISVHEVALSISAGLAKATLAAVVNDTPVDSSFIIDKDATIKLVTAKDDLGLEILRHSCAHLLAQAVKILYPSAEVAIGPVIEDGFYYDFAFERAFTVDDLAVIEQKMAELAKTAHTVSRKTMPRDQAIEYFESISEHYKAEIIRDLPQDEILSIYTQGDFSDLCRGPHVPNTGYLKAFKLMRVAGAYWRGDPKNPMLSRIYGTCWADKKQLKSYLIRLEEAQKRDHRKIGKAMGLFHFEDTAPGIAFWHVNGTTMWRVVEAYMRASNQKYGCTEIKTPLIADVSLWHKSGHMDKYQEHIFITESQNREYAIRPMNCPMCVQVYNQDLHSYRDLPIRMAEFGVVHRNEPSGALHGLLRVQSFTQDDGHVFCTEEQVKAEVTTMIQQCFEVYHDFGFKTFTVKLALRPENRVGSDQVWDKSETALAEALSDHGVEFEYLPGEGAFYGPKIEFHLKDAIDRSWQCGTIQLDFSMPARLGASYIDQNSHKQIPVMLHRAIVGSLERFIGVLIEHYAGDLPLWLAPIQIVAMGISNKQDAYVKKMHARFCDSGIRSKIDLRNEKIGFKIREHTLRKVPFIAIVGDKEESLGQISVRKKDGTDLGLFAMEDLTALLHAEIAKKGRRDL